MPKQLYKITQFHGGLNSNADPRDIAENELAKADGIMVDNLGKIRAMGSTSESGMPSDPSVLTNAGHGLFTFSHDRDKAQDGTGTASTANPIRTDYLAIADTGSDAQIDIYSSNSSGTDWGQGAIDLGTDSSMQPVYYAVDGNLRVHEGDFSLSNNESKWLGYVNRDPWIKCTTGTTTAQSTNSWRQTGALSSEGSTWAVVNEAYSANPGTASNYPTGADVVEITSGFSGSGSITGSYNIGVSTIYDGTQETGIYKLPTAGGDGVLAASSREHVNCIATIRANGDGGSSHTWAATKERITGFNIYYKDNETEIWYKNFHISMESGIVNNFGRSFSGMGVPTGWVNSDGTLGTTYLYSSASQVYSEAIPFSVSAGYPQDTFTTDFKMKAAVVANRRVYAGNVKYTDSLGNTVIKGDAVVKSPVNCFDIFPSGNVLEASVNDGDDIIALASYADRLLIFKRRKMELMNISQEMEFVEDTFHYKGVLVPSSVCTTDFGIAWANQYGCYLYDGQKVSNLIEKNGRNIVDDITWGNFANGAVMVGFLPKKRQLIVKRNSSNSSDAGDIYLFDIVTRSWTFCSDKVPSADSTAITTNFAVDWNGDLILGYQPDGSSGGTIVKWDDSSVSQSIDIETKDFDFGQSGQRKNIYKVYISYTGGSGQNCNVQYKKNGSGSWLEFNADLTDTTGNQVEAELAPSASITNIKSLQLKISGTCASTFELNDLSIVFRLKKAL